MSEKWTTEGAPMEAYDRLRAQLKRAETLLAQIRNGKHSLPGTLVQVDRYFENRGRALPPDDAQPVPGAPFSSPSTGKESRGV